MSHDPPAAPPGDPSARLANALRRVLRPVVRLMLSQSIPFQHAAALLKQVYVDVASGLLDQSRKRASDSRLSMITGVHRKEIRRLREATGVSEAVPPSVSLGSQLIARWTTDMRFLDDEGRPLPLPRSRAPGDGPDGGPSFDELVVSVSSDIHPRSVLDEWQRLGVVQAKDDKRIHLVTSAFVPRRGFEEKLYYLGRNGHDHLDAMERNLRGEEQPLLERSVHYDELSRSDVNLLARFAEQEGMKLLESINRMARELRSQSDQSSEAGDDAVAEKSERMNFGLYFFRGPNAEGDAPIGDENDE